MASLLSWQSVQALGFVASLVGGATALTQRFLPKQAPRKMYYVMLWLTFDALCHMILEASWLYLSTGGRTVNKSSSFFALLWQDYSKADQRWGWADPTVVSLEILTVLGAGPMAAYCAYLIHINDITYHYWVTVLSTAELYGGFMTFAPEWLSGNKYLVNVFEDWLLGIVYLCFMNLVWVAVPIYLMYDSYDAISNHRKNAFKAVPNRTTTPRKSLRSAVAKTK